MSQENIFPQPESEKISKPQLELKRLNTKIWETKDYLMHTFFPEDTWNVRQAAVYGAPLFEVEPDDKNHNWKKEEQIVTKILADLGNRLDYYEAAYHFPDKLAAFGVGSGSDMVTMMAERSETSEKQVATSVLAKTKAKILEETPQFEEFLESETLQQAFTVLIDKKTGSYTISDLHLDTDQLKAKWSELISFNTKKKANKHKNTL